MRIRTIKPEFWSHSGLYRAETAAGGLPVRLFFIGLWCQADREGRLRCDPLQLKALILPYDPLKEQDVETMLAELENIGSIERYQAEGKAYAAITSWHQHQCPNNRERKSELPAPPSARVPDASATRAARDLENTVSRGDELPELQSDSGTPLNPESGEGKGREGKGKEGNGNDATESPSVSPVLPPPAADPVTIDEAWTYARNSPVTPPWTRIAVEYWHNERSGNGWRKKGGDGALITTRNWRQDLTNAFTWAIPAVAQQVAAQRTQQRETEKKEKGGLFASAKAPDLPLLTLQRYLYGNGDPMDWRDMPESVRGEILKAWGEQNDAEKAAMWKKEESRKEEAA